MRPPLSRQGPFSPGVSASSPLSQSIGTRLQASSAAPFDVRSNGARSAGSSSRTPTSQQLNESSSTLPQGESFGNASMTSPRQHDAFSASTSRGMASLSGLPLRLRNPGSPQASTSDHSGLSQSLSQSMSTASTTAAPRRSRAMPGTGGVFSAPVGDASANPAPGPGGKYAVKFGEARSWTSEQVADRLGVLFQEYGRNGLVNGLDVVDMFRELGMPIDEATVRNGVPSFSEIDFDTVVDLFESHRGAYDTHATGAAGELEGMDTPIHLVYKVSWPRYVASLLPCWRPPPGISYRPAGIHVRLSHRQALLTLITVVVTVTGLLIVLTFGLMWGKHAAARETAYVEHFETMTAQFGTAFRDRLLVANGQEMRDLTIQIADCFTITHRLNVAAATQFMRFAADLTEAATVQAAPIAAASARLRGHGLALAALPSLAALASALRRPPSAATVGNDTTESFLVAFDEATEGGPAVNTSILAGPGKYNAEFGPFPLVAASIPWFKRSLCAGGPLGPGTIADGTVFPDYAPWDGSSVTAVASTPRLVVASAAATGPPGTRRRLRLCTLLGPARSDATHGTVIARRADAMTATTSGWRASVWTVNASALDRSETDPAARPSLISGANTTPACAGLSQCSQFWSVLQRAARGAANQSAAVDKVVLVGEPPDSTIVVAKRLPNPRGVATGEIFVLVVTSSEQVLAMQSQREVVIVAEHINQVAKSTVEIVVGTRDSTSGRINVQATRFRFPQGCHGPCRRTPEASVNVFAGFISRGSGFSITPDYRPEPCMGAYTFVNGLSLVLLLERDVTELNENALRLLVDILNFYNSRKHGTLETHIVRVVGMPPNEVYDPNDPCPPTAECLSVPDRGVVFRSDCPHCSRKPTTLVPELIEYLTQFVSPPRCARWGNNPTTGAPECRLIGDAVGQRLVSGHLRSGETATDYTGSLVIAAGSRLVNFSVFTLVKEGAADSSDKISESIWISVGLSLVFFAVALIALIVLSRNAITRIESDQRHLTELLDQEKDRYSDTVRDIIPPHVAQQTLRGRRLFADVQNVCFLVLEAANTRSRVDQWPHDAFTRFTSYVFYVIDSLSRRFLMYKVRSMGDCFFLVSGLCDLQGGVGSTASIEPAEACLRALRVCVTLIKLCDRRYAHYPARIAAMQHLSTVGGFVPSTIMPDVIGKVEHEGALVMPEFKIGVHFGPCISTLIQIGHWSRFDLLGPAVGIAFRVVGAGKPNNIVLTAIVREYMRGSTEFEFSARRATVIRGKGTVSTYLMSSSSFPLPRDLLHEFGIKLARRRVVYGDNRMDDACDRGSESLMSTATYERE